MTTLPAHDPKFKPPSGMGGQRVQTSLSALDAATGAQPHEPVVYDIPRWWSSNDKSRVRWLRKLATSEGQSPELREWVVNHVLRPAGAGPHDHRAQAAALLAWVQHNTYYVSEPGEQIQTVSSTLRRGFGDCDDQSVVLAAMAHSVGLPFRFCLAGTAGGKPARWCEGERMPRGFRASHVYVQIGTPALSDNPTWYSAEPTIAGLPLGHDVVLHGVPSWMQRTDVPGGSGKALGAWGGTDGAPTPPAYQEGPPAVTTPADTGMVAWVRNNVDLGRVLSGAIEGTITAIAIAYATRSLRGK